MSWANAGLQDDVKPGNKALLSAAASEKASEYVRLSSDGKLGEIPMFEKQVQGLRGNKGVGLSIESLINDMRDDIVKKPPSRYSAKKCVSRSSVYKYAKKLLPEITDNPKERNKRY